MRGILIFIITLLVLASGPGCRKNLKGGCRIKTDTVNYDPTADYEDGSCIFISEINIIPDSVEQYPVDIYIDNNFRTRLTSISKPNVGFARGYVEKFPSNEIHQYRVVDDFGKIWEDTFSTYNVFTGMRIISLKR